MGVQQLLVSGAKGTSVHIVTVGTAVTRYAGYDSLAQGGVGTFGSINNANLNLSSRPVNGIITAIYSDSNLWDFRFVRDAVDAPATQNNVFSKITVIDLTDTVRVYTSATATYIDGNNRQTWTWGDGTNPVWTNATASVQRSVAVESA